MANAERILDNVIRHSDILLLVVDARNVEKSINRMLEARMRKYGKRVIYVINKCDLVSNEQLSGIKLENSVKLSALRHGGTLRLLKIIKKISKGKDVTVGVVGLPNTGKSTLINTLKGKKSAPTSPISGFTKGMQKIRVSSNIMMLDTPGIFSYSKKKGIELIMFGAIDADKVEEPEMAAAELIETLDGRIEEYFGIGRKEDGIEAIEEIAIKKNFLKKGNKPDTDRMAREIIRLCQRGKIRWSSA